MRLGILYTSGTQLAIQAIGIVTGVLVARFLGPGGRGELAAVISWSSMIAYLGNGGLPVALAYASARNPLQRHQLMGNGVVVASVQLCLLIPAGCIILPWVLASYGPDIGNLAVIYLAAYLPFNLLTLYANAIQQGSGNYIGFNAVRLCMPLSYALILILIWLTAGGVDVSDVLIANLAGNVLTFILAIALIMPPLVRLRRLSSVPWFSSTSTWRNLKYGISAQIGTLQPFSGLQIDVLALTLMVSTHDLGLYVVAWAGANVIRAQGFALGQVVLPEIAKYNDSVDQWRVLKTFVLLATLGGLLASGAVLVWAEALLELVYGSQYVEAAPILKVLCVAGSLSAIYRVLADGLRGVGRPAISTAAEIAGVVVGLFVLAVCVPLWGALGAAIGVLAASALSLSIAVSIIFRAHALARQGRQLKNSRRELQHDPH